MKLFISHSSLDSKIINRFLEVLREQFPDWEIVYSSLAETGSHGGDKLAPWINKQLQESDLIITFITDNYIKSLYCLYELNLSLFLLEQNQIKKLIPVFPSRYEYEKIKELIAEYGLIFLDASKDDISQRFIKSLDLVTSDKLIKNLNEIFNNFSSPKKTLSPYIGLNRLEYNHLLKYCQEQNITRIQDQSLDIQTLIKNLKNKKDIYIVTTTGIGLIRNLRTNFLVNALGNGTNISIITPNEWSEVLQDLADIEDRAHKGKTRIEPLSNEFKSVIGYLKEAYSAAQKKFPNKSLGEIRCFSSYTLLRQTIILGVDDNDSAWSWLSVTLPPKRTNTKTLSFEVSGNIRDHSTLIGSISSHCDKLIEIATERGGVIEINDKLTQIHPYYFENKHALDYWKDKYNKAETFSLKRKFEYPDNYLIEVAAQHPLRKNKPNEEFKKRLDYAIKVYENLKNEGNYVKIYIPGSRHRYKGKADLISLSQAGKDYLIQKKIPEEDIFSEEMNDKYKGADGVYNSADECFVSSKIFKDNEFGTLICICSPNQITRKTLFYYEFGIVPLCLSAPAVYMFHSMIDEIFQTIPNVLYEDHNWQDKNSERFINSRIERNPDSKYPNEE